MTLVMAGDLQETGSGGRQGMYNPIRINLAREITGLPTPIIWVVKEAFPVLLQGVEH